ncbi:MAG: hypothetical protein JWP27_2271 [Flaviaesturariibacter sp.]|nr:hypothetical protein [Flaviaesturariibacter sp.]
MTTRKKTWVLAAVIVAAASSLAWSTLSEPAFHQADRFPYSLGTPTVVELPVSLNEISGIVYSESARGLLAIEDEDGSLFTLAPKKNYAATSVRFAKRGDYEDIALIEDRAYVLLSNGNILSFDTKAPQTVVTFHFPDKGRNEFETLVYDPPSGKLLLFCKSCKGSKGTMAWTVDPASGAYGPSAFSPDLSSVKGLKGSKGFQPSAAAVHPSTGDFYLLSSHNKRLVVTDRSGVVKYVQELDPVLYKQPEGICFLPDGSLVISNERSTSGTATLLISAPR